MFKTTVNPRIFTDGSPEVRDIFGLNLYYDGVYGDYSLCSTIRALLYGKDKMYKGNKFSYIWNSSNYRGNSDISNVANRIYAEDYPYGSDEQNKLFVLELTTDNADEKFDKLPEALIGRFGKEGINLTEIKKIRAFYKKTMNVISLIDVEKRISIVIVERKGLDCHHYAQLGIPTYIPWFFQETDADGNPVIGEDGNPKIKISDLEFKLIHSLRERTSDKYLEVLDEMITEYGIEDVILEKSLTGFEKRWAESIINNLETSIYNTRDRISSLEKEISSLIEKRKDLCLKLTGARLKVEEQGDGTLDYFRHNKNFKLESVSGGTIYFEASGYLEVFDEDVAESFIDNDRSVIYSRTNMSKEETKKVFRAVFVDQLVKIKSVAKYSLNIDRNRVEGLQGSSYSSNTRYPNPHIHFYSCLGDYSRMMCEALDSEDTVQCLELCGMSVRSLNFADETVMKRMIEDITSSSWIHKKIYELPDGTSTDFKGVLEYVGEASSEEKEKESE